MCIHVYVDVCCVWCVQCLCDRQHEVLITKLNE